MAHDLRGLRTAAQILLDRALPVHRGDRRASRAGATATVPRMERAVHEARFMVSSLMSHASRRRATGSPRLRSLRGTVRGSLALSLAALALAACAGSQAARPGPVAAPRAAATSPASPAGEPAPPAQDPATARSLIASGAVVLDVRTPDEFATGHVSSAVNVPVQELPRRLAEVDRLVGGDRSRPIVVYCGSGRRAGKAKSELEAAGYTQVVNGGGFDDVR